MPVSPSSGLQNPNSLDEKHRLAALQHYEILDSDPEFAFDRLTALAARVFEVPIALVSLVDAERLWFKSCHGLSLSQMPRHASFCDHVLQSEGVFIVPDARLDARFCDTASGLDAACARFYAGAPLKAKTGAILGTLCLIDTRPRQFSPAQIETLSDLAAIVVDELELRLGARRLEREIAGRRALEKAWRESEVRFESAFQHSGIGMALLSLEGDYLRVNACFCELLGYDEAALIRLNLRNLTHPDDLEAIFHAVAQVMQGEVPSVESEKRVLHADGHQITVSASLSLARDAAGLPLHLIVQLQDISARRQAEIALRQSEARKAAIVETALDCIVTIDSDDRVLEWNPAAEKTFGWTREQAIGAQFHQLIVPPEKHEEHLARIALFLATGADGLVGKRGLLPALRADGTRITIEVGVAPILDFCPPLFSLYLRDVTDRQRAQERLRLLESVAVHAHDAILITEAAPIDLPGPRILYANEAFLRMTGYTLEEIIGQTPRILHGEGTADAGRAKIRAALKKWQPVEVEILNYKKDGTPFWVEISIVPIANEAGWFTHWVSIQRDITERKQFSDALLESEGRYERIAANVPGMVYQFWLKDDGTMSFPFVSDGCREVCGLEPVQLMANARLILDSVHPDDVQSFNDSVAHSAQSLEAWEWEGRVLLPGQPLKWIRGSSRPQREADGVVWDGLLFDVTQRKAEEEVLQIAKHEAEVARREAERANLAKSEFLSRMSHELRTPLNAILGFGQLLEMAQLNESDSQSADQIVKAGRHLLDLINEVLDIARIESGQVALSPEAVKVSEIALETLDLVRPLAAARGIVFDDRSVRRCECFIRADRQRLKQVLLNLLSNAVKYNREGGRVTFSCLVAPAKAADKSAAPARIRLSVADTGAGIEPALRPRLFTPFDRLGAEKSEVEGTGMGLALSRRLAHAMGGELDLESAVGEGSTFWIELPRAVNPIENLESWAAPAAALSVVNTQLVALYIEDNPSNLQLVQGLLSHRPEIRLLTAMQGGLGYELARQHLPDVILLDMNLPDMSGAEVLSHLRQDERTCHIPVIVVSADATPGQIQRLLQAGAQRYLTKPFDVRELLALLDENIRLNNLMPTAPAREVVLQ